MRIGAFKLRTRRGRASMLLATTLLTALAAMPVAALAQEASEESEDIIVTGSQIARTGFSSST